MRASLLVTTFCRNELLEFGLDSMQVPNDIEVIVLDDGLLNDAKEITNKHGFSYLHTGHDTELHWRIPGYALNIGAKRAKGDVIIITCAEMYHVNNCIDLILKPFENDKYCLTIPNGAQDYQGAYLNNLKNGKGHSQLIFEQKCCKLKNELPFFLGVNRNIFLAIGGYDEDFIGQAFDDNDIVERLINYGCYYQKTQAQIVHLHHNRSFPGRSIDGNRRWNYNRVLYEGRLGTIIRNENREWGVLNG